MSILVVGASGATGRLLVEHLLKQDVKVKIIVRSLDGLPNSFHQNDNLTITKANILDLSREELIEILKGCEAVASCLGHTLSLKGIYGKPHRLVTDAASRICDAIEIIKPEKPIKFILMNTSGNSNRDLDEKISFSQKLIIGLIRFLVPPHADNEEAADYLRTQIGQKHKMIEYLAVRPDGLIHEDQVTEYEVYASPIRSAIFDAGKVSRINVAHFMATLISNPTIWMQWRGKMPVIYNQE